MQQTTSTGPLTAALAALRLRATTPRPGAARCAASAASGFAATACALVAGALALALASCTGAPTRAESTTQAPPESTSASGTAPAGASTKAPRTGAAGTAAQPVGPGGGPGAIVTTGSPAAAPRSIALVLPLSGRLEAAGTALRDGFMTAWYRGDPATRPDVRVYDAGPGAQEAYRRAIAEGAGFVVGPLAKEDVQAVASVAKGDVGTLVLNALPDAAVPPPNFFQFALSPEDEARQVAERLVAEGRRVGVALVPSGEWGSRVLAAFQSTLEQGGGAVVARQFYSSQMMDYSDAITAMLGFEESKRRHQQLVATLGQPLEFAPRRRDDVQFVFVAGQPTQGRLIRPQLKFYFAGDLPVYSTSDVYDPNPTANEDLEGVVFPDTPWMISPDPAIAGLRDEIGAAYGVQNVRRRGRLYAMGYDAYAITVALRDPATFASVPVAGMTGRLTLGPDGRIRRSLDWAAIGPDGQPRPLPPTAAVSPTQPSTP